MTLPCCSKSANWIRRPNYIAQGHRSNSHIAQILSHMEKLSEPWLPLHSLLYLNLLIWRIWVSKECSLRTGLSQWYMDHHWNKQSLWQQNSDPYSDPLSVVISPYVHILMVWAISNLLKFGFYLWLQRDCFAAYIPEDLLILHAFSE